MNFDLSDEQQQLSQSLARLLGDHGSFEKRCATAQSTLGWNPELWKRLSELGVTALGIPESYGGLGGGAVERLSMAQEFGRALLLEPYLSSPVLGATAVVVAGGDMQKSSILPRMASGELLLAWAHEETSCGSNSVWVETSAINDGGQWRLDGGKCLVLHAPSAHHLVVSARTHGNPDDSEGLALFLVDAKSPGLNLRSFRLVDDTPAGELALESVLAEPLGNPANGESSFAAINTTIAMGVAAACADMLGVMENAFALTASYVTVRKQFSQAIGGYQAVRHRMSEMLVSLELSRSMAMAAAFAADHPNTSASAIDLLQAKLFVGRHARTLCQAAIQSHGGIGMTEEYAVGHCLRRVHVLDQLFGDSGMQATRLADLATEYS